MRQSTSTTSPTTLAYEVLTHDHSRRESLLLALQDAAERALAPAREILRNKLTPVEREIQDYVESLPLSAGAWYRPIHNVIVPLAMLKICEAQTASRDLVIAAQLHDIGYSAVNLQAQLEQSRKELKDARTLHMDLGAKMAADFLATLKANKHLVIDDERILQIKEIIATHDNPYLGKQLVGQEALLHRDADRCFVLSCVSFWKDYLAYISDPQAIESCNEARLPATPDTLLNARRFSFGLTHTNVVPNLNESGPELPVSQFTKRVSEHMLQSRHDEIPKVGFCLVNNKSPSTLFYDAIMQEMQLLAQEVISI